MLPEKKAISEMTAEDMFEVIEENAKDGVDFITVHCGVTRGSVATVEGQGRVLGIVSRGGSMTANWMYCNKRENPLYEEYDRLLEIAHRYDMVLSLGDGLRPGAIEDATDQGQLQELIILGQLAQRARAAGVQVMIEGPGHVPITEIEANIKLQKKLVRALRFMSWGRCPQISRRVTITLPPPSAGLLPEPRGQIFFAMLRPRNICDCRLWPMFAKELSPHVSLHISPILPRVCRGRGKETVKCQSAGKTLIGKGKLIYLLIRKEQSLY